MTALGDLVSSRKAYHNVLSCIYIFKFGNPEEGSTEFLVADSSTMGQTVQMPKRQPLILALFSLSLPRFSYFVVRTSRVLFLRSYELSFL